MLKRVVVTASLLLSCGGLAFAQATSTINGRVVDQGGAVLPGVTVTVTNTATGAARDTVTNGEGLYNVPALLPGTDTVVGTSTPRWSLVQPPSTSGTG